MKIKIDKRHYGADGKGGAYVAEIVTESYTLTSAGAAIRFIQEHGRETDRSAWSWWSIECVIMSSWKINRVDEEYIAKVHARYQRFCHYVRHERGWTTVPGSRIYWMDNSVTEEQVNVLTGNTRTQYLIYPHGDVCY